MRLCSRKLSAFSFNSNFELFTRERAKSCFIQRVIISLWAWFLLLLWLSVFYFQMTKSKINCRLLLTPPFSHLSVRVRNILVCFRFRLHKFVRSIRISLSLSLTLSLVEPIIFVHVVDLAVYFCHCSSFG